MILYLTYLITTAIHENNDIKIAAARVDEFMGMYGVAKSDFYPKFNIDASGRVGEINVDGEKYQIRAIWSGSFCLLGN